MAVAIAKLFALHTNTIKYISKNGTFFHGFGQLRHRKKKTAIKKYS